MHDQLQINHEINDERHEEMVGSFMKTLFMELRKTALRMMLKSCETLLEEKDASRG